MQYRMCTSVDCVKQVGVVLCDCDPLGACFYFVASVGGKLSAHTHTGSTAREQVKRRRRLLLIRGFVNGTFFFL